MSDRGTGRPRVLFVTGHLPYPPISGGRRREFELLTRLAREFAFHVLAVSKTPEEDAANARVLERHCDGVSVVPASPPRSAPAVPELVLRHWSDEATELVASLVAASAVDLIHVEGFYLMHHVPEATDVPVLLVEQNVEYTLWHQRVRRAGSRRERRRRLAQYGMTVRAEIDAWKRSTLCAAVTEDDARTMLEAVPDLAVRLVPDGADHVARLELAAGDAPADIPRDGPLVVFVGNFGYAPNVDAAVHLCREIFPRVRSREPTARLLLVGNAPPREVLDLACDDTIVTGRVPSIEPYLDAATVVVCPLREGGGVKVKMLEAMAHGKAVVSTSVGAQGLGDGVDAAVRIEDRPRAFANAVADLLDDADERRRLEARAREFAARLPSWDDAARALASCYRELGVGAASRDFATRPSVS